MVEICREDILLIGKTFFCLNTFQFSENSFVRKMFDLLLLLILQLKFIWFTNQVAQFLMNQK